MRWTTTILAALLAARAVAAQQAPAQHLEVTLREAIERALLVQPGMVQALGDVEELVRSPDGQPADVEPRAPRVAEERSKHLGHASAFGGGVDHPQRSAGELGDEQACFALELVHGARKVCEGRVIFQTTFWRKLYFPNHAAFSR